MSCEDFDHIFDAYGYCVACGYSLNLTESRKSLMDLAVDLGNQIYAEHSAGGWCHIVLDDDNVEDEDILHCILNSIEDNHNPIQKLELSCMGLYLQFDEDERMFCNRRIHGR